MDREKPSRRRPDGWLKSSQRALCALLVALALAPLPASAQSASAFSLSTGEVLDPMILQNPADMDFGRITPGTANGTVVMTPNGSSTTATCTTNNGIVRVGTCRSAQFQGNVPFIFNLQITKPAGNQAILTGPAGATMRVHDFTFAKGSALMLGGTATDPNYFVIGGAFEVFVGATLDVSRTQRAGLYTGSFTLTFNYN